MSGIPLLTNQRDIFFRLAVAGAKYFRAQYFLRS
jgi:hypothetical protein